MKRLVKTPKLHLSDTGLACSLMGLDPEALWVDRATFGRVLETFVYQELKRQASWHEADARFHHYRDKDLAEVDIVIERGASQVGGVEVKAAATVSSSDFRGLRRLKEASGKRFAAGRYPDRNKALPGRTTGRGTVFRRWAWVDRRIHAIHDSTAPVSGSA